jgi:hypothetical protein
MTGLQRVKTDGGTEAGAATVRLLPQAYRVAPRALATTELKSGLLHSSLNFALPSVQQHVTMGEANARRAIELDPNEPMKIWMIWDIVGRLPPKLASLTAWEFQPCAP